MDGAGRQSLDWSWKAGRQAQEGRKKGEGRKDYAQEIGL